MPGVGLLLIMKRLKPLATVFAALSLTIITSSAALGCVCNIRSLSKRKGESRSVFVGTLIGQTQDSDSQGLWRNQFVVERYWKGINAAEVTVYTTSDDCASHFELGKKYLVFAYFVKEGQYLETDSCIGTGRIEMVAGDLKKLGKGKLIQTQKRDSSDGAAQHRHAAERGHGRFQMSSMALRAR
jgi:hypothetical protein